MRDIAPIIFGFAPIPVANTCPQKYELDLFNIAFKLAGYIPIIGTISSLAFALLVCCKSDNNEAKRALLIRASLTLLPIALLVVDVAATYLQHQHIKRHNYYRQLAS